MSLDREAVAALSRHVVVTGTDTGVGKTFASAELLRVFAELGERAVYVKPAQTGVGRLGPDGRTACPVTGEDPDRSDAATVQALLPGAAVREGVRLSEPLSPRMAAEIDGVRLPSVAETAAWIRACGEGFDRVVVEGAGGLLVDVCRDGGPLELASALAEGGPRDDAAGGGESRSRGPGAGGASLVLVARAGLGTLNHTALSLREARRCGWEAHLCVGAGEGETATHRLNRTALREAAAPGHWLGEADRVTEQH
ncbi:ATP-dependent dethiobiotin synthetase BioD [Arthrobacter sp. UM1]|uniref:ATP-dependent dethiobiotin synthetase BioD n=1 Tax=Arthrobacter sp. UM1 TaxID=2766776 RepID=UPI001CF6747E|nr:dethiobiotin synthase [Arthrobacter sp. UM1]MCB4208742.1 dethiobiotin synthase [Arthrobacter sp. UM1]